MLTVKVFFVALTIENADDIDGNASSVAHKYKVIRDFNFITFSFSWVNKNPDNDSNVIG